ncbi:MAG TPA: amino acid ABC transporter permease [Candidatus Limnocylindrales bacterium]
MALSGGGPHESRALADLAAQGRPRLVHDRRSSRRELVRSVVIAVASSVVFFGVLGWIIVNSSGWPEVRQAFLDERIFWSSLPATLAGFVTNIQLFAIAEVLILVLGLLLAVMRSLPGPAFFPLRFLATLYVDVFRALPGVLVIFMLGFGIPGLAIAGLPVDPFPYAVLTLTLLYSAYVSEVYRAGIESVHPSQEAAARSLGLNRFQALRYVIVPQAIRRVIPPLLNDFIGLQKDTVLVSFLGVVEIFRTAQITNAATFNFTPYLDVALVFIVITIPLARLTDWLVERERRGRASGGLR